MYTLARSKIGVILSLKRHMIILFEGDVVSGLSYYDKSEDEPKLVTVDKARVRVIHAAVTHNTRMITTCPPDPYVFKQVKPQRITFDVSEQHDASFLTISCEDIVDIEAVNDITDPEVMVDHIFESVPGMVMISDNVYQYTTPTGTINNIDLFDQIIEMEDFSDMIVTVNDAVIVYSNCIDLEEFKTEVDKFAPMHLDDPTVDFNIRIILSQ